VPRVAKKEIIRNITPWDEAIKQLRLDRQLTQKSVADYLGISQRAYSDYELGVRRISVEQLLKLSRYYGVSMDELCKGFGDIVNP
jgi:transcriptional regulator with XRE-family HTH domain